MLKKFFYALAGLTVIFGTIFVLKKKQFAPPPPFEFPPEAVTSAFAQAQDWERLQHAVGSLRADQGVTVSSEGQGKITHIAFESGAVVAAGAVLVELDSAVECAQLASAESRLELARVNIARAKELLDRNAMAKSDYDGADASFKQAAADMQSLKAILEKKVMRAPFAGRTGIRLVNLGQYLDRGNPIVTLQALDPIHADFALPQQSLADVKVGYVARVTSDARPGVVFVGKVTAISPEIDATTRTIRVEATLANADEQLSPGMFVNVDVIAPEKTSVIAVPVTAVYYQAFGDSIFVAKEVNDGRTGKTVKQAEQRFVRLGEARGDFVAVLSGIKAGEEVATTGVFKLSNGTRLLIDNSLAPKAELAPQPNNS
ncbi:MAG: efflux RND transporter periplasmic adaptor subunit [Opitutaceae bacterium]|nr:efflux RND transporter periplasmic adaptor subunit [Opitutaceae bacterium]